MSIRPKLIPSTKIKLQHGEVLMMPLYKQGDVYQNVKSCFLAYIRGKEQLKFEDLKKYEIEYIYCLLLAATKKYRPRVWQPNPKGSVKFLKFECPHWVHKPRDWIENARYVSPRLTTKVTKMTQAEQTIVLAAIKKSGMVPDVYVMDEGEVISGVQNVINYLNKEQNE